jgi:hypothetical protein
MEALSSKGLQMDISSIIAGKSVETISAYQLYSIGLVKRIGDKLTPSCQLYQQYFREHLQN